MNNDTFYNHIFKHIIDNPATNFSYNVNDISEEEVEYAIFYLTLWDYDTEIEVDVDDKRLIVRQKPRKIYNYVNPFIK